MTAPRAREQSDPPAPPDRRPPRRGGGSSPSPYTYASAARRGLVRSARALAAAALLALAGALALPATAQAQTATTLVSNIGQSTNTNETSATYSQRFTTGSNAGGYTLTGVDIVSGGTKGFTAKVCGVDSSGYPTSTCTDLMPPDAFAAGTLSFTPLADATLMQDTTYAVVASPTGSLMDVGRTSEDGEDMGFVAPWSIANEHDFLTTTVGATWQTDSFGGGRSMRIAIKGTAVLPTPVLSVADAAAVTEGSPATFTVTLTPASTKEVTVQYSVGAAPPDQTATTEDFTFDEQTLTFAPGETMKTVTVATTDDALDEADEETFHVNLSHQTNATFDFESSSYLSIGTINDNDAPPTLSAADVSAEEGDGLTFTVALSAESGRDVTVAWAAAYQDALGDMAEENTDFTPASGTLTFTGRHSVYSEFGGFSFFATGETSKTFTVSTTEDSLDEANETFTVTLSNPTNAGISDTTAKGTITNDDPPAITGVEIASTPVLTSSGASTPDTYGLGETIEISVTFSAAVAATADTDFVLSVSGAKRAALLRGSGTQTLVFGYAVQAGDEDDNGIWIGDQDRTLVGDRRGNPQNGAITSVASGLAVALVHSSIGTQSDHKVDGSRSIVSVAVSSTPMLETDTYGGRETIRFTVTFNAAVNIGGDPVFRFSLGNTGQGRNVDAAYESGTGTTALVFGYTVQAGDSDDNGIWIGDQDQTLVGSHQSGTITIVATGTAAGLAHAELGAQSGHKVDGSRTTSNNPPTFDGTVTTREVPENSAADTEVSDPVTATDDDDDTLTYTLEGTDAASFTIDSGTGQIKTVASVDYNHEAAKNTYQVTVKADDGFGGTDTIDVTINVTDVNEQSAKPAKPTLAKVTGSSTSLTATWTEPDLDGGPAITGYDVAYREGTTDVGALTHVTSGLTTTITGLTADTSYQVRVRAKNGETDSDWSDASDAVRTNRVNTAPSFTSPAAFDAEENAKAAGTVEAEDGDTGDAITGYAISGGVDQALFEIGATDGALSFKTAPNFEDPQDQGAANTYEVTVQATSGAGEREKTATQTIAVTVTDAAEKPGKPAKPTLEAISGSTSLTATWTKPDLNGGPEITGYDVQYRQRPSGAWTNVPHAGMAVTTTITGLTADTSYQVRVRAKNEELDSDWSDPSDAERTPANPPELTSASVRQNGTTIILRFSRSLDLIALQPVRKAAFTLSADGANVPITSVIREAGGAGASRLHAGVSISNRIYRGQNMVMSYDSSEATIVDADGELEVESFTTGSGGVPAIVNGSIHDNPSGNNAPSITSQTAFNVAENATAAGTVEASDSDTEDNVTGYAITGGADQALFSIDSTSGALTFDTAPDFEDPQDQGADNTYEVTVQATSGMGTREKTATQTIAVTVINADEGQSGTVTVDDTSPMVGDELTASAANVADPDGLPDPFAPAWRWYRTPAAGSETEIPGAALDTYTVVEADLGATLTAKASWTDKGGFANTLASAPTSAVADSDSGTLPTLSVGDAAGAEDEGVEFTLTLTATSTTDVTATWTASVETGDSASTADLATTKTGTVTVDDGDTTAKFTVPVNDDNIYEDDETFTVTLSGVSTNAQLAADPTATGTIDDNENPPKVSFEQASYTAAEGGSEVEVVVTLTSALPNNIFVTVTAEHGAGATAGDYQGIGTRAVFIAGFTRFVFTVTATDDMLDEADETVTLGFTIPSSAPDVTKGSVPEATLTLTDNDERPTVTVADAAATEGDKVEFVVTLSAVSGRDVTVDYATSVATGDDATSGTDFTAASGTLTIAAADSTATGTIEVQTAEDDASESAETFTLTISSPTNATLTTDTTATGTIDNRAAAPTITDVEITSTPVLETDTYGAGETIRFTVTFSAAVDVTGDPHFAFSLLNGEDSAPYESGSGTRALVFGYTVVSSDEDDDGIFLFDGNDFTNRDGPVTLDSDDAITAAGSTTTDADLAHTGRGTQSGHKVDGSRSIVSVAVSSTPMLETDTYGAGETIRVTVTFSAAVNIGGNPVFRFSLGNLGVGRNVDAAYESGTGTTALVFGYTVVSSDEDDDGIWIGDQARTLVGSYQNGTITIVATSEAAGLAHAELGLLSGHKVDGSRTTGNNAPVFTSSANLSVKENTANATVAAVDNDTDDDITDYAITGGTDQLFFSEVTSAGVLSFDEVPNFEDPKDSGTDNTYAVTVEATSGTGTREMTATQTITVTVTDADEKSAKPDKPTLAKVTGSSTSLTATWTKPGLNGGPEITGYDVQYKVSTDSSWTAFAHTGSGLTTTITGLTADTSYQVRVRAKNGETDSDWSDASTAVSTNAAGTTPTITAVAITSTPVLETDTYGQGERIEVTVTFSEAVNATDATTFVLSVGGDDTRAPVLDGSGTTTLVFSYTVRASDGDDNGIWIGDQDRTLVGDRMGLPQAGAITSVATSTAADLSHSGLGTDADHKVDGSRSIVLVAVSSTPMLETDTYGAGETIRFTVTFSSGVSIGESPVFRFSLGNLGLGRQVDAAYESGAGSAALVFGYTVVSSDEDDDGIWIGHQGQTLVGTHQTGTITIVATSEAAAGIEHDALGVLSGHKVDGSRSSLPTLSIRDDSRTEGELFVFVLLLSDTASEDVPVTCTASFETGDTAVAGDLTFTSADGRIQSGQNRGSCSFRSVQDGTDEEDETFTVTLSSTSSNAQLASDPTAKGTINDDDDPPTLSVADVAGAEGEDLVFTVALSAASGKTVTVAVATSVETGDTATSGTDFTAVASTTLTFDAGQEDKTVTVQTTEDATEEENETFTVTLSGPTNATLSTTDATAKGTIIDDDATVPTLSVADAAASEGDDLSFAVTLSAAAAADVTVDWTASIETGDTAVAADLGTTTTGMVSVSMGTTTGTFTVSTTEDSLDEDDETFTVTLSNVSSNAQLAADPTARGTITDDDNLPELAIGGGGASEASTQALSVSLTPASGREVMVTWTATIESHDTAEAADFTDLSTATGTVTIPAGQSSILLFVRGVIDDSLDEDDESFTVTLSSPVNATLSTTHTVGRVTIQDDDDPPTVTVADGTASEGDKVEFVVTLSAVSGRDVDVDYATSVATGDDAVSGTDFTAASGTLTIEEGDETGTIEVQTTEDSTEEEDETFTLTISDPANATLGTKTAAKGTIEDDDGTMTPTTCTLNTGDVWCGAVTVATETTGGATTGHGFSSITGNSFGTLTDNSGDQTFTYGTQTYVVSRVVVGVGSFAGELAFRVQRSSPENFVLDDDHRAKLALHVAGSTTPFAFRDTTGYNALLGYVWSNSGLDWSSATTVTVRLRELPDAPTGFEAAVGNAQVALTWDAPVSGANITRHEFRYKTVGSYPTTWTSIATSAPGGTNEASFTVTGLTNEIAHTFELRAVNDSGGGAAVEDGPVTPTPGICDRTAQVRDALLGSTGVDDCKAVTVANLASVQVLLLSNQALGITALKSGDFAGLTAVTALAIGAQTGLTALPSDVFSGLSKLGNLALSNNSLGSLRADVFSGLTALSSLQLQANDLTSLPAGLFTGLTALEVIRLEDNDLDALPAGLFTGLTALELIRLEDNDLDALPAGLFTGLTALTGLILGDNPNTDNVLPLTVTVEKVGTDEARAEVAAGAPFAVAFTPVVVNGSLPASDTKLTVPKGSVEGTEVMVTRTAGTTEPVTVDIDLTTQPSLPSGHSGYEFVKATSGLPAGILSEVGNNAPVFDDPTAEREVPENSAAGTDVGAVIPEATDADSGDTLTYSLEGTDARSFAFDDSTRQITTRENVTYNYEAKSSYSVRVKASDGTDSATLAVTIRLTDVAELAAKPAPPTLSPISGSSTSLMASWVKPGRNGGPDITGYNVQYREGDGAWTDFAHDGTGVSTTITGLTAGASYQARVQAENGEGGSAWSDPSDAAVPNEAAGVLPRITAVRVTSVPELERDTYGRGETIRFTVYFSAPVAVTGSPHFTFSLGNRNAARRVDAPYESGSGTAALVFGYVVQEGDEDDNGIFLVDGDALGRAGPVALDTDETITALGGGLAADLSSSERGNQRDHKVDGSRALEGDAPTVVGRLKVTSWPVRGDGVHALGDTILFTLPLSEPVRTEGQPQPTLAFELGGATRTARYWGLSDTEHEMGSPPPEPRPEGVKLHFGYTVKAGDRDDDGVSVGANAISLGGARVRSTVTGFDADLTHVAVGPFSDHRVDAGTATEPAGPGVTILYTDGNELEPEADGTRRLVIPEGGQGRYGLKLNTRPAHPVHLKAIMSDGDEDLAVLPSFTQPSIAPGAWGAPRWVDIAAADDADSVDGERVFLHRVHSKDPAYNDLLLPDVVVVEADDDPKESGPPPPEITAVAVASEPELESDTYGYGETIRFRVEFSEPVTVGGQPHFTFSLGNRNAGRRVDAPYESGNRTTALVFGYEVQRGDEDDNGIFLLVGRDFAERAGPVGLGRGGLILAVEGGVAADLAHDTGRGAQRGHQVDGSRPVSPVPTPPTNPTVDSLAVNSWPRSGGEVYRSGDEIVFTVTFSEKVRVEEGRPALAFDLGGAARWGVYHGLSDDDFMEGGPAPTPRSEAAKLHFAYQVDRFDRDADGVEVGELSGALDLRGGTIRSAETGLDADLGHAAGGPLSDPVDGVAAEPATAAEPLTAEFRGLRSEHDGETAFRFRIEFSEEVAVSAAAMRDEALTVTGGAVTGAARVDGRADLWSVTVTPSGTGEVTISLLPGPDCAADGAVCTADGRKLSAGVATIVAGPSPANAPAEGAPTIEGTARVGETLTASTAGVSDADGLENAEFRYQWIRGGADISGATGSSYTAVDADAGERLKVRVAFEDDAGNEESLTSAATDAVEAAPRANTPAEGRPAISGKARVGGTLTASTSGVTDADGLDNATFAHQWLRGGADIPGATGATYALVDADEGERLKARVEFTDDAGNEESLTSAATKAVAARPRPKVSVADARVREAAGATLDFAVTLSAPAPGAVTVGYRTMDASAKAGEDYEAREGKLRFGAGETAKTLRVTVLDDAVDEGDEKMVVVLEPGAGVDRGDRLASGTIENGDPLPAAWLARFGRTASDHAAEAIEERFRDPGGGSHATFGGRRLWGGGGLFDAPAHGGMPGDPFACGPFGGDAPPDRGADPGTNAGIDCGTGAGTPPGMNAGPNGAMGAGMDGAPRGPSATGGHRPRLRDLLLGSSFRLSASGADEYGAPRRLTAWGRAAATRFDGVADGVAVDGEVATFLVGADASRNRWLAGITVAHSVGAGAFRGGPGGGAGGLDSTLTAVHPYARWRASERLSAWGALGYGAGDLALETNGSTWETDTSMRMAAGGLRGVFLRGAGGLELAARTDVRLTRIASDGVEDNEAGLLAAAAGGTSRLRLLVEGSRPFKFGETRLLTPTLEIGVRRDGGDAETGAGIDLGGSLRYADAALGLTAEAAGRYLVAHEDAAYREWGASASVRIDPGAPGRGLTLSVTPSWGASATGGAERLWSVRDARGLAGHGFDAAMRLRADVGYGLSAFRGMGAATPFLGLSTTGAMGRDWRFGARWTRGAALRMSLEATRREAAGVPPARGIQFGITWRPGARGPSHAAAAHAAGAAGGPDAGAQCPGDGRAATAPRGGVPPDAPEAPACMPTRSR